MIDCIRGFISHDMFLHFFLMHLKVSGHRYDSRRWVHILGSLVHPCVLAALHRAKDRLGSYTV